MITNKTISLSDLLRDFNSGLNKQAEDAPVTPVAPEAASVSTPAPEVCPECGQSPCVCQAAPSETDAMQEAAATVDQKQNEAVDAAKVLKNMADEYIAKHDNAIAKEAEVFGEIFAQAAYDTMKKQAAAEEAYNNTMGYFEADNEDDSLQKQAEAAFEQAYRYTLCKIAAEEAYAAASPEAAAAQAVSDSASAAKALVEHLTNKGGDSDPESAAGAAAAQAYQETMNQLGGGAQPAEDEQAAAAQAAYDEAAAQMQAAPAQNAYDTAMQQLQQQAQ